MHGTASVSERPVAQVSRPAVIALAPAAGSREGPCVAPLAALLLRPDDHFHSGRPHIDAVDVVPQLEGAVQGDAGV